MSVSKESRQKIFADSSSSSYQRGVVAEKLVADFLLTQGYEILERRLHTPYGEIDLIALKNDVVIIVEVKYRRNLNLAAYALQPRQQKRLIRAVLWLQSQKYKAFDCSELRFDVFLLSPQGALRHISNAFSLDSVDFALE